MEGDEVRKMALPEELVETILGKVPFPYIFKARALSKSWLARLSPVSSHDDVGEKTRDEEDKKPVAITFQSRMAKFWSTKFPTFCPVFWGKVDQDLMAYDRVSRRWQRLPSLSFLPEKITKSESLDIQTQGSFLFINIGTATNRPGFALSDSFRQNDLFVANVLTRSWKQLPPRPVVMNEQWWWGRETAVCHTETYKVFEFYEGNQFLSTALIYDSKKDAWSTKTLEVLPSDMTMCTKGAHFNGALYWLVRPYMEMPTGLLVFNVQEDTFQFLELPALDVPLVISEALMRSLNCFHLFVCDGSLLMVVLGKHGLSMEGVIVKSIDLESRSYLEVTRGTSSIHHWSPPASDGDCIFLVGLKPGGKDKVFEYNVQNDVWSSFPLPEEVISNKYTLQPSSFQPGLNPLLAL